MDAKEAVSAAKGYIKDTFGDEDLSQLALEEIDFDEASDSWLITLGFMRPVDRTNPALERLLPSFSGATMRERVYRVVKVRDIDGTVASVKIRELAA